MYIYKPNSETLIPLGRVGENKSRKIIFDISEWEEKYGTGQTQLMARRPNEPSMYPISINSEEGRIVWSIEELDVAIPGQGECQLTYSTEEGVIVKSSIFRTRINPSMNGEEVERPDQPPTWPELAQKSAEEAEAHALWTLEVVRKLVEKELITPLEYEEITGEAYN